MRNDRKFDRDRGENRSDRGGRDNFRGNRNDRGDRRDDRKPNFKGSDREKGPRHNNHHNENRNFNRKNDDKPTFFKPSFDVIVSVIVNNQSFDSVVKTLNSVVNLQFFNKKIVVSISKKLFANQSFQKLLSHFRQYPFIEFNQVANANHKDNIFNLCKGFARHYLLIEAGIEVCQHSAEKMCEFLKQNRNYYAASPTFYYPEGQIVKTCRRFPNLVDILSRLFAGENYKNSKHYLNYNMLERGDSGYLKIHSVSNPVMDCIMIDGEFVVKKKPIYNKYSSNFLNYLKLAKKIVKNDKKIVYFPIAKVIKHEDSYDKKPSIFECIKFFLGNGIALKYKPSH